MEDNGTSVWKRFRAQQEHTRIYKKIAAETKTTNKTMQNGHCDRLEAAHGKPSASRGRTALPGEDLGLPSMHKTHK